MTAIKGIAKEPSTTLGSGFIALAIDEFFMHGFTAKAAFILAVGVLGVLLRENSTALPANGKRSTSVSVSAEVKKEESNHANI